MRVAVLGLGAMGIRMAERWHNEGHTLQLFNRTEARAEPLVKGGASVFQTPKEAARDADAVVSMVRDDEASRSIWLDSVTGAFQSMKPDALAVESSTLTPAWVGQLSREAELRGFPFLEAPVAGSRPQAEAGQLIYFVGGSEPNLERARPLLEACASSIHPVGDPGMGAVVKLCVNALFGIQTAALAEVLGLATRSGMELQSILDVLEQLPITSPAMKGMGRLMANRSFAPQFPIDLVDKDFGYVLSSAHAAGASVPVADAVWRVFHDAVRAGHGGDNISGIAKLYLER